MVVSASLEDCVTALHSLEKDGWLISERVFVKTRKINDDLYEFEVKLRMSRGKSSTSTLLHGTLRYKDNARKTTVMAEVLPKKWVTQKQMVIGGGFLLFLAVLSEPRNLPFLLIILIGLSLSQWVLVDDDKIHTQQVITMTEQALRLTTLKKGSA